MGRYQAYPEYKNSGVEVIGEVPKDWVVGRLKQIVDQNRQITYGIVQAGANKKGGIPYIRPADMTDEGGVKDFDGLLRTSPEIAADYERSKIKSGDIVCSIGPSFGKLMITPEALDGANLTQGTARVAISSSYNARYFFWALRATSSFQQWESSVGGATFRALNLGPLADTFVVVPSKSEQQKIANFLDFETAKIDTLIDKQQQLIKLLKEKRQAVISHAVTKGLNPNAPMRDSGVEWLGEVPAGWDVSQLKYKVKPGTSITYGIVQAGPHIEDGIPYIKTSDMSGDALPLDGYSKTSKLIDDSYKRSKVYEGDLVIGIRASVGKCLPVHKEISGANLTQGTAKISPCEGLDRDFLLSYLSSSLVQTHLNTIAKGATFKEITLDMLRRVAVLVPSEKEQAEITERVSVLSSHFSRLVEASEKQMVLLSERRTALISAAVTGKIDVRHFNPKSGQAPEPSDNQNKEVAT